MNYPPEMAQPLIDDFVSVLIQLSCSLKSRWKAVIAYYNDSPHDRMTMECSEIDSPS